jgi:carbon-monoxide dehydrogenase medium subunit
VLIDLNRVEDLARLSTGNVVEIGAAVRQRRVEIAPEVHAAMPLLPDAIRHIAHPQVRNRGTVVGSLVHNDPAAELPAVALVADARVHLTSSGASRTLRAAEFIGEIFNTAARPDELVERVTFPPTDTGIGHAIAEVARRPGDFALAGVACQVHRSGGSIGEIRVATFGVGAGARDYAEVTARYRGTEPTASLWRDAAEALAAAVEPHSDTQVSGEFRRHLVRVLAQEAMTRAWARSEDEDAA